MTLFEYAVIFVPNDKAVKAGAKASVLVQPTTVLAEGEASVQILAAKKIPNDYDDRLDQVKIAVRPF